MQSKEVDILPIAVAQSYSVLVEAKNETGSNFALMAYQDPDMYVDSSLSFLPDPTAERLVLGKIGTMSSRKS
jgi:hypothetical protein